MHAVSRVHPGMLGKRCLNQDFRDSWIHRMQVDEGCIPFPRAFEFRVPDMLYSGVQICPGSSVDQSI